MKATDCRVVNGRVLPPDGGPPDTLVRPPGHLCPGKPPSTPGGCDRLRAENDRLRAEIGQAEKSLARERDMVSLMGDWVVARDAELDRLRAEIGRETTYVACDSCGRGVRARHSVLGLCGGCAAAEIGRLRAENERLVDAYIHESPRPDCLPSHRFRAVLAIGFDKWCATKQEARDAIRRAARLEPRKDAE